VGPAVRGSAIVYDILNSFEELPAGWTAEQEAGRYRLKRRDDGALFGYAVGAHGWKKFLYPAEARVFAAQRNGDGFRILNDDAPSPRYAFGHAGLRIGCHGHSGSRAARRALQRDRSTRRAGMASSWSP
jgi:hypothetical protein